MLYDAQRGHRALRRAAGRTASPASPDRGACGRAAMSAAALPVEHGRCPRPAHPRDGGMDAPRSPGRGIACAGTDDFDSGRGASRAAGRRHGPPRAREVSLAARVAARNSLSSVSPRNFGRARGGRCHRLSAVSTLRARRYLLTPSVGQCGICRLHAEPYTALPGRQLDRRGVSVEETPDRVVVSARHSDPAGVACRATSGR